MKKVTILLIVITIISKIMGLSRDIYLSYLYGASNISDAYLVSLTIPTVIFSFIATGISAGYIPVYAEIVKNKTEEDAINYTNNLLNILLLLSLIVVMLCLVFLKEIVYVFASGFDDETLNLAIQFTRIGILSIFFLNCIQIYNNFLQIKGSYLISALTGIPYNITLLASMYLSVKRNLVFLSIGNVIGVSAQTLILLLNLKKLEYKYKFRLDINNIYIHKTIKLAIPAIIGISANQINIIIDRTIASNLEVGGISILNYANKLNGFIQGVFVLSIASIIYPKVSQMANDKKIEDLKKFFLSTVKIINTITIPSSIGLIVLSRPIVEILFGRGAFDSRAVLITSEVLIYYSVGILGFGLRPIITRIFYSLQDSKTPMFNGLLTIFLNVILNILLSKILGVRGLALATSISATTMVLLLFLNLQKKIGDINFKEILIAFFKILLASLIMALVVRYVFNKINILTNNIVGISVSIIVGICVYFILILIFKVYTKEELKITKDKTPNY